MVCRVVFILLTFICTVVLSLQNKTYTFPDNFIFGASASAYQVEGAWNVDGKAESIWDYYTHNYPKKIYHYANANIASDSYYLFQKDIAILKNMNINTYRFSIPWTRVLPNADTSLINYAAIRHYQTFVRLLKEANIRPIITLYHWDLPQILQKKYGGWENPIMVDFFEGYARVIFENFADEVDWWATFNEPINVCYGYSGEVNLAPDIDHNGYGEYKCINTILLSHARVYHLYKNNYCRDQSVCKMAIILLIHWPEPNTSSPEDIQAANDFIDFHYGVFAHPIYSKEGDYPEVVKRRVGYNSLVREGLNQSRLIPFTQEQIEQIRGTADYLGMNHYQAYIVTPGEQGPEPSLTRDIGVITRTDPSWPTTASPVFQFTPFAAANSLRYINSRYSGYDILITEIGFAGYDDIDDKERVRYLVEYAQAVFEVKEKYNIPLIGTLQWTAIDDFEWNSGYGIRFGMVYVNFSDPLRTRTLKRSANIFREIARTRQILPLDAIDLNAPFEATTF